MMEGRGGRNAPSLSHMRLSLSLDSSPTPTYIRTPPPHHHRFMLVKQYDKKMSASQQGTLCQQTEQGLWMKAKSMVRACVGALNR